MDIGSVWRILLATLRIFASILNINDIIFLRPEGNNLGMRFLVVAIIVGECEKYLLGYCFSEKVWIYVVLAREIYLLQYDIQYVL